MRWIPGTGDLWRVRVDVFSPADVTPDVQRRVVEVLVELASEDDGASRALIGVDHGTGIEGRPVLGLTFWLAADSVGAAASGAVDAAASVTGAVFGAPLPLYDVVVIPRAAVSLAADETYPPAPD